MPTLYIKLNYEFHIQTDLAHQLSRDDEHFNGTGYEFAPASMNRQKAASVAVLGEIYYKEGKTEPASEHLPDYLRLSQAERELIEKRSANG